MEIDDEEFFNFVLDDSKKIKRNYQNSKMIINQINKNDEIMRLNADNNNFYKRQEMQNDSMKYLTSCSDFIYYNTDKNCNSIYEAKQQIKNNFDKIFEKERNVKKDINNNDLKSDLKNNKDKIFKEKFRENIEYKNLIELINQKDFDEKMKNNEDFRNSIFLNKYFIYFEKSQEIMNKYSSLLPNFIYNVIKEKFENNKDNFF